MKANHYNRKFFYELVVEGSNQNPDTAYRLKLRRPVFIESITEQMAIIETESVSQAAKALMWVDLLREEYDNVSAGFLLAAARPLEPLLQNGNQTPVIHRLLGDIYLQLGRWQQAEELYQKVLLLAAAENNPFETAAAQVGMAHIALVKQDFQKTEEFLLEAQHSYEMIGDEKQVEFIQGWLERLRSKL